MADDLETRRKRALYRAQHRGTKEMDWMIGRYGAAHLDGWSEDALGLFEAFLEVSDVELNKWLMAGETPADQRYRGLVTDIRGFHKLPSKA